MFAERALAWDAFGDRVVEHYLNLADEQNDTFFSMVPDWELFRSFERM